MLWTTRMNEDNKNILINFMPLIMVVVFTVLILLPMYFLQKGVEKTIVAYNEDTGKFIMKEAKEPETGTITIEHGDSCYAVEGIFVVCGK